MSEEKTSATPRWLYPAAVAVSAVAVIVSFYLTHLHTIRYTKELLGSLCTISDVANCQITIESKYSELFGVPISNFAVITYVLIGVVALSGILDPKKALPRLLLAGGAFTTLVSLVMAYLSYAVLKTICPACTVLYVCSFALLAFGWIALKSAPGGGFGDEISALFSPKLLGISGASVVASLLVLWGLSARMSPVDAIEKKDPAVARPETPKPDVIIDGEQTTEREDTLRLVARFLDAMPKVDLDCGPLQPKGNPNAPVMLVEFADFQCPACKGFVPALKELVRTHGDRVKVCYRNYPLDGECNPRIPKGRGHQNACEAARASICASQQGKLWEIYEAMFEIQGRGLNETSIRSIAKNFALDMGKFEKCMKDPLTDRMIRDDLDTGTKVGVEGTPTIIVNGRKLRARPDATLLKMVVEYEEQR
ncbi:MAG: thioredoxin domain-containing protein [Deltaproteobacteria bacterium]|nr:thioredoxin domain-containing protein [Deltaproteobacteria bacterium]